MTPTTPLNQPPLIDITPHPPKTERLSKQRLLLVGGVLGLIIVLLFALKLQSKHTRQQTVRPAPLPGAHEVSGPMPKDPALKLTTSYEGLDRSPKVVHAAVPATPAPEPLPDLPPFPEPVKPVWQAQQIPPPPAPPVPPPRPVQQAAPAPKPEPPKRWLFADVSNTVAKPPFPKPSPAKEQGEGMTAGEGKGEALLHPAHWTKPADPTRVLYRAQVIPGMLMQDINSDIPGLVRIHVTRPVTDRFHQGHVLIPQHSIILGAQEGKPQFGQTRLNVTIDEIQFPDGTVVGLKGQLADRTGAAGATGNVNNHYVKIGIGALISAALNIGTRAPFGSTSGFHPSLEQEFARDVGQTTGRTGQSLVDRQLNVPPTIKIPAGTPITVQLSENVSFARPPAVSQ